MSNSTSIRAGRAFVELFADDSKLVRGLRRAEKKLKAFGSSIRNLGLFLRATTIEKSPWDHIPNEPITLDQFMVKHCEKRSKETRKYRRKARVSSNRSIRTAFVICVSRSDQPLRLFLPR